MYPHLHLIYTWFTPDVHLMYTRLTPDHLQQVRPPRPQRGDLPVLLGREPVEDALPGVNQPGVKSGVNQV